MVSPGEEVMLLSSHFLNIELSSYPSSLEASNTDSSNTASKATHPINITTTYHVAVGCTTIDPVRYGRHIYDTVGS